MQRYDIVVVGAGPAGLAVARAAGAEARVLVCEMQASIGGQAFSLWLPKEFLPDEFERAVVQKTKGVKFRGPKSEASVSLPGVVVDWKAMVRLLALQARRRGAEIWISSPAKELLLKNGKVVGVRLESGGWREEVKAEVVVDASGCIGEWGGLFLRLVGRELKPEQMVFSGEHLMAGVSEGETVEFHFSSYLAPLGNAWIHPFGEGFAVAGIQGLRIHPEAALNEFVGRVPRLAGADPIASTRGRFPDAALDSFCADGMLAVGGSAWQVLSLSRGGVFQAIRAGELAAKVALDAITEGDTSKQALQEYDRLWKQELGQEFEAERRLYSRLSRSWDQEVERMLESLKGNPRLLRRLAQVLAGVEVGKAAGELLEVLG
ncbi:MAG: NAD(P)/FAD-dependent oxidoreductase [Candidatus Hadarchaeales archaeon]